MARIDDQTYLVTQQYRDGVAQRVREAIATHGAIRTTWTSGLFEAW